MIEADEVSMYICLAPRGIFKVLFPAIRRNQIIDILSRSDARRVQARRRRREGWLLLVGWKI